MNYPLIWKYLGTVALLIAGALLLSLPWAHPALGGGDRIEWDAISALVASAILAAGIGSGLKMAGRRASGTLYRKETMAIVGLSWVLASLLGAVPFLLSGTHREPKQVVTVVDALFESTSGFSGTGATILTNLEDTNEIPRAILFWRSETHFLGGLGIMVLFVAILGQGSAGKALMRAEMPGPSKDSDQSRSQHAAWVFAVIYLGLIVLLTVILLVEGMSLFDALCHSFGAVATGGFSTYNRSVAEFGSVTIEMTIAVFMVLACTNFALLYAVLIGKPLRLLRDVEFRTYVGVLLLATLVVTLFGIGRGDFQSYGESLRFSFFQVVSIVTNTGFATHDFNEWNELGRGLLFLLMFVGGCAGSTSCSIKVIRHILFLKILRLEIEHAYRPSVVRPLRLGGKPVDDPDLRRNVVVYFGLILFIVVSSWTALLLLEPDASWVAAGHERHEKLIDCASAVGATLNGVGPGLGTIGATETYAHFQWSSKLIFVLLMLLGRLEVYAVVVLFLPSFWRGR